MMSRIAPRVARTSLVSAAGGYWKCMPRSVPLRWLKATLAWAMTGFSPCAANSFWQKARAKNPRSSSRRSRSMMKAPLQLGLGEDHVRWFLARHAARGSDTQRRSDRSSPAEISCLI